MRKTMFKTLPSHKVNEIRLTHARVIINICKIKLSNTFNTNREEIKKCVSSYVYNKISSYRFNNIMEIIIGKLNFSLLALEIIK
jgi:hypothetical protein